MRLARVILLVCVALKLNAVELLRSGEYDNLAALMAAADRRYTERFEAQEKQVSIALEAQARAVAAALAAADKATTKAEFTAETWRANANEWRGAMNDREKNFVTRVETDRLTKDIQVLTDRINTSEGRGSGLNQGWVYLVAAVGVIGAVYAMNRQRVSKP